MSDTPLGNNGFYDLYIGKRESTFVFYCVAEKEIQFQKFITRENAEKLLEYLKGEFEK